MLLMAAVGFIFTACQKDDTTARAILASVNTLEFKGEGAAPETILVTSDGDWTVEAPEWVTVTPNQGTTGQTEVTIEVADNFRDGALDNPRRDAVQFTGANLWAHAIVKIRQDGDKYRDPKDYSVADFEAAADETVVRIPGVIVSCLTSDGFIATTADGKQNVYVKKPVKAVAVGDKVSVQGEKWFTDEKMSYLTGDRIQTEGTAAVPTQTPVDATATLDALKGTTPLLITVDGAYDGSAVKVAGQSCALYFENPAEALNVKQYTGHKVKVTGYYYGTATPVIKLVPVKIEDMGLNQTIYFSDDFEWLAPWVEASNAGQTIEEVRPDGSGFHGNPKATTPQLQNAIVNDKSAYDALIEKGYDFEFVAHPSQTDNLWARECTYLQNGYIKLCKTMYHAGLILPKLTECPGGEDLILTFDWAPMITGSYNFDTTLLCVILDNAGSKTVIELPGHGLTNKKEMSWTKATVALPAGKVDAKTKITIRPIDSQFPVDADKSTTSTIRRFFIDNIKVVKAE